ncbi:hypothetical protein HAX54_006487 [Datura stramonium]|uniref:Uncharacterized protein n=1 Tax=Datura stramonium TaxID=4076 RepID=A0ABS8TB83_DATST|nr:hypothetical protein [Datura stramonium]
MVQIRGTKVDSDMRVDKDSLVEEFPTFLKVAPLENTTKWYETNLYDQTVFSKTIIRIEGGSVGKTQKRVNSSMCGPSFSKSGEAECSLVDEAGTVVCDKATGVTRCWALGWHSVAPSLSSNMGRHGMGTGSRIPIGNSPVCMAFSGMVPGDANVLM